MCWVVSCIILVLCLALPTAQARSTYNTTAQRQQGKLNLHIITHVHLSSWQTSYAETYSNIGRRGTGADATFDDVVAALLDNPDRTFVCSELAFFVKWWQQLHPGTQQAVKQLVQQGRWEFVNGGLVQVDEATSHYSAMLDQMTMGMRFLYNELEVLPRVAWSTDAAGHSATEALLKASGGFAGVFHGTADPSDLQQRQANQAAELIWRSSPSCGRECDLFTVNFQQEFWCPATANPSQQLHSPQHVPAFNTTPSCALQMIILEEHLWENSSQLVDHFVSKSQQWSRFTHGGDVAFVVNNNFSMHSAADWYSSLDRLVDAVNVDGRINAFYSTPSWYLQAKMADENVEWAVKEDDFMSPALPIASKDFWTGLYSSRPGLKVSSNSP
jgi:alpha-mannosidase